MKAFWWFKEGEIAGMGRPGFNAVQWFDLSFRESAVMSWIGQYPSGAAPLEAFRLHLRTYIPRILKFHSLDERAALSEIAIFNSEHGLASVLEGLNRRAHILKRFSIAGDELRFEYNGERLQFEIEYLKTRGIDRVVTLTERHHAKSELETHFAVHHIAIQDLAAPEKEQALELADILRTSARVGETVAVHCLAGIGRTSTMIMGAHILMGARLEEVKAMISKANPTFVLAGHQEEFLNSLSFDTSML